MAAAPAETQTLVCPVTASQSQSECPVPPGLREQPRPTACSVKKGVAGTAEAGPPHTRPPGRPRRAERGLPPSPGRATPSGVCGPGGGTRLWRSPPRVASAPRLVAPQRGRLIRRVRLSVGDAPGGPRFAREEPAAGRVSGARARAAESPATQRPPSAGFSPTCEHCLRSVYDCNVVHFHLRIKISSLCFVSSEFRNVHLHGTFAVL